jgi:hypothetical protein
LFYEEKSLVGLTPGYLIFDSEMKDSFIYKRK